MKKALKYIFIYLVIFVTMSVPAIVFFGWFSEWGIAGRASYFVIATPLSGLITGFVYMEE